MAAFEVTRKADYAVRIILFLARQPDHEVVPHRRIAGALGIPLRSVVQVVGALHVAGLVWSTRGRGNGVVLTRRPAEISLRQVIEATEGPLCLNRCLWGEPACPHHADCLARPLWQKAQEHLCAVLASLNLHGSAVLAVPTRPPSTSTGHPELVLSAREREVVRLVGQGLTNRQVASALGVSESAIKARLTSLMSRLGVRNRAHVVAVAMRRRLV